MTVPFAVVTSREIAGGALTRSGDPVTRIFPTGTHAIAVATQVVAGRARLKGGDLVRARSTQLFTLAFGDGYLASHCEKDYFRVVSPLEALGGCAE